jgi:hypothetical protein
MIEDQIRALSSDLPPAPDVLAVIARGSSLKHRRRIRRLATAGALVALAATVIPVISFGGLSPSSTSQAAVFLTQVSARAGSQTAPDASKAAYWYSKMQIDYGSLHFTRESWLGHYTRGHLIQPDGVIGTTSLDVAQFPCGSTSITWDQLFALPRDPGALYDWMKNAIGSAGHDPDSEMFVAVGDLLRESPAPPSLRQALYLVAAKIPDVSLTTGLHDSLGRSVAAVSRPDPNGGGQIRYLIDPNTGALLGEQDVNTDSTMGFQSMLLTNGPVPTLNSRV